VSAADVTADETRRPFAGRRVRFGDLALQGVAGAAAAAAAALVGLIASKLIEGAWPSISAFGFGFVTRVAWNPVVGREVFGAASFLFGTAITSLVALALAGPLAIAVALFLTELAPRVLRAPATALVETLAAIPSVVIGLWGIFVLGPFLENHLNPFLHRALGWTPFFRGDAKTLTGLLPAALVLTIMVIPISASIARELFLSVPNELEDGALALGLTRWEMVRGVVLPYTRGGVVAAIILGFGRAVGEAIAVTQVIGGVLGIHLSLFAGGDTLASRIAAQYQGAASKLQLSSLVYLAVILLAISLVVNLIAQLIVRRFEFQRTGGQ